MGAIAVLWAERGGADYELLQLQRRAPAHESLKLTTAVSE